VPRWLNRIWFERQGITASTPWMAEGPNYLCTALQRSVVETSLPGLLRYEDRNSMAHSVESRLPFLTTNLAEFILSLPEHYLIADDGTSKSVFREAMRGIVPGPILARRDKIGFATPERHWLKQLSPWVESALTSETARDIPVLNIGPARKQWARLRDQHSYDESPAWRWVNLVKWVEQFDVTFAP
jgi:asparagine synthase (glutamine-hydrolysing)